MLLGSLTILQRRDETYGKFTGSLFKIVIRQEGSKSLQSNYSFEGIVGEYCYPESKLRELLKHSCGKTAFAYNACLLSAIYDYLVAGYYPKSGINRHFIFYVIMMDI